MAGAAAVASMAAAAPAALGASPAMHPMFGARLTGMGEHGIVNLHSQAAKGKLCWSFDLPTATGITGASIHAGAQGVALVRLGTRYIAKGCTTTRAMTLEHLEAAPRKYSVWVDTKGHPGDLRGTLAAGVVHM
jgi:hypothetical protein